MNRGLPFTHHRFWIVFIFIFSAAAGLSGCDGIVPSQQVIVALPICTPMSPMVNVYRAAPQPWANMIFESAFPPIPTPVPPTPPIQFNEQSILSARFSAFQQLVKETKRWSDTKVINLNNSGETRITITYISPELLQAVFLNDVLKNRFPTFGFLEHLQGKLNQIAERDELLFLVTIASKNNSFNTTSHAIKIPIEEMVLQNAENVTVVHAHDDHNLAQIIDTSSAPIFGYLGYPLSLVSAEQCSWILDPKYNTTIVITVPYIQLDNNNSPNSYFWTIPYAPLIEPVLPTVTAIQPLPLIYDPSQYPMTPLQLPPTDASQSSYWDEFARFIWGQVTLANY